MGLTVADAKLEVEAELAAEALRRLLIRRATTVSPGEVVAFYRHNPRRFVLGELRETELIEGLPSRTLASALVKRAHAGKRLARPVTNYETLKLAPPLDRERAAVLHAIFTARQGVTSFVRLDERWAVFVVRRIFPPRLLSLAEARTDATAALVAKRRRELTAQYLKAYRSRWSAKTRCEPAYIVQGCGQYRGPLRPEANPLSGS